MFKSQSVVGRAWVAFGVSAIAAIMFSACTSVSTTSGGAVGVDREQTMMVSAAEVNQAAAEAYAKLMREAAQKNALNRDSGMLARVKGVAARLIPQTKTFRPDAPSWAWEVNVITSEEINAWCMPGGKMAVYTGIIEKLKLTDDELAAIMGHEIAHALREHGRERVSQQMTTGLVLGVAGAALGLGKGALDLAGIVTQVTIGLPNSRGHEVEADRIGVELAARAGYEPQAAVRLWQKMAQQSGGGQPQFLSTHPSPESRIRDLTDASAKVAPLYDAARAKR